MRNYSPYLQMTTHKDGKVTMSYETFVMWMRTANVCSAEQVENILRIADRFANKEVKKN